MRSEGHPFATRYPLAVMWNELAFVKQRLDARHRLEAVLMQAVIGSAFSKEGGEHLKQTLEDL